MLLGQPQTRPRGTTEFDDAERVRVELMAVAEKTIADMLAKAREERARADANELLAEQRPPPNMEAFRGGLTGATTYLTVRETLAMLTTQRRELLAARKRILVRALPTGAVLGTVY